jgi:hypothetical protein
MKSEKIEVRPLFTFHRTKREFSLKLLSTAHLLIYRKIMFSKRFHLLSQECSLIEATIYSGLTDLCRANIGENSRYFYTALFGLSIGFERILKLVLILDYIASNHGQNPTEKYIRDCGHDLIKLRDKCNTKSIKYGWHEEYPLININDVAFVRIFEFLDRFARITRYENLNRLTGGKVSIDPLEEWKKMLLDISQERFTKRQMAKVKKNGELMTAIEPVSYLVIPDLDKSQLSHRSYGEQATIYQIGTKYIIWDISKILTQITSVINKIGTQLQVTSNSVIADFPFFSEFFVAISDSREFSYDKRRWP